MSGRRGMRLVALAVALLATPGAADAEIRVAMRGDAKPFVYQTGDGEFTGFLADICRAAVAEAGYADVTLHRIDSATRFSDLGEGPEALDLVCDPTTLTLARAERLDFSPIVFIANATFAETTPPRALDARWLAQHPECAAAAAEAPSVAAVGMLRATTAAASFRRAVDGGWIAVPPDFGLCVIEVESHPEGIARLCSGELSYYFADADILRAYLADRPDCRALLHPTFLTYEPYALVLGTRDPEFRRRFVRSLYTLFSNGFVDRTYAEHFGERRRSDALEMLFQINSVPAGASPGR